MTENVLPLYKSAKKEFDGFWREKQPAKYFVRLGAYTNRTNAEAQGTAAKGKDFDVYKRTGRAVIWCRTKSS